MHTEPVLATAAKASVTPAALSTISSGVGFGLTRGSARNCWNSSDGSSWGGANRMRGASPTARSKASASAAGERSTTSTVATARVAVLRNSSSSDDCTIAGCIQREDIPVRDGVDAPKGVGRSKILPAPLGPVSPDEAQAYLYCHATALLRRRQLLPRWGSRVGVATAGRAVRVGVRHRGQFRLAILGSAHVAVNVIVRDAVDHQLHRLRIVGRVEHHRLVQVHVLLRERAIVDHQFQVGKLVLGVGLAQAHAEGPIVLERLRLVEVELVIVAFALLLEEHQLIVGARDRAG